MRQLVTENSYELKKVDNQVNQLVDRTNNVIQEMYKLDLEPTKAMIEELLNKTCKRYFEDVAINNLVTPLEGLKEESIRLMLELPNYTPLQSRLTTLQSLIKYWSCIDIVKGVARINEKALDIFKDTYRTYATTSEEIELLNILEGLKDAFNKADKQLQAKRDKGLLIHGSFNWRQWLKYNHYDKFRFEINPNIYNHLLGR